MSNLEYSAESGYGETAVTADVSEEGVVTLVIGNHVATVRLILGSLTLFSDFERFIRAANSPEISEYIVKGATGVMAICSRQNSRVIFSIKGDASSGEDRHQIDIHLYGPRLTEFLNCLSELREDLTTAGQMK